jgi:hypothetical protein
MQVRLLRPADDAEWFRLRDALSSGLPGSQHREEMAACRPMTSSAVFVADRGDGRLGGFL